jgi:hypothetical protein
MASFHEMTLDESPVHPSIAEKGITTIRLQRLHLSSSPCPRTLAMSWPHSQRVSLLCWLSERGSFVTIIGMNFLRNEIENDY